MEILLALCLGVTLSAACGFRVFIPPLVMSLAAIYGELPLAPEFAWVGTYPAAMVFGAATVVEVLAYYVPLIDNLLDTIEIPTAMAIGTMLTAASLGDVNPVLQWTLAAIVGGGSAGIIESFTSITRLASTAVTGGLGNPLLATMEALSAGVLSILAITLPFMAAGIAVGLLIWGTGKVIRFLLSRWRKQK